MSRDAVETFLVLAAVWGLGQALMLLQGCVRVRHAPVAQDTCDFYPTDYYRAAWWTPNKNPNPGQDDQSNMAKGWLYVQDSR